MTFTFKRPQDLTIKDIEEALDIPADRWHGNCYGIASGIVEAKLVNGKAVYGAWTGEIHPHGWWGNRAHMDFVRHGWVRLPGGKILDPTRWSFEADEPYIWCGKNDGTYDEGNDHFRKAMHRECPPADAHDKFVELPFDLATQAFLYFYSNKVLPKPPEDAPPMRVNFQQGAWIANAPMMDLDPFTKPIYQVLVVSGHSAWIPMDNRMMVLDV